ncbi:conserved hypothetical protein [Sporisorium reilianum SRZ2]|uniref:Uncharacterized protein n=1 Tax=Sporisorium reilianum (strain SRZ2) TaxID=999809 RepID=E6ZQ10_SPORE|nr:conserved hypothetical protein [Sporisorium reilianum SRZ2]
MSQKEIIYLSFGSFSNHISTHFWNQQQSYFTYDQSNLASGSTSRDIPHDANDDDEPLIDHDVSFQAGQTLSGQDTYSPRAVLFETQHEFGALSRLSALYDSFGAHENVALDSLQSWGAEAQVIAAERTRTSVYQHRLELEDQGVDPGSSDDDDVDPIDSSTVLAPGVPRQRKTKRPHRFWSDYARTPFHAKSLVSVGGELMAPMPGSYNAAASPADADGRTRFETFAQGSRHFTELEAQHEVLDTNIRWFAEDADQLQGLQYTLNTSDAFGGLGTTYLEHLLDEYPKLPHFVFAAAWGSTASTPDDDAEHAAWANRLARLRRMNELQALVACMEAGTLVVPLSVPRWDGAQMGSDWRRGIGRIDLEDMHHAAALVSAHLETATLGTRLKARSETLGSLAARLNWRRDTKLVHLGGVLPLAYPSSSASAIDPVDALLQSYGYGDAPTRNARGAPVESASELAHRGSEAVRASWLDLSLSSSGAKATQLQRTLTHPYAHSAVLRNTRLDTARLGLGMLDALLTHSPAPFTHGVYIPLSYNLPSSFPNLFSALDGSYASVRRPETVPVVSSLMTTPSSVLRFKQARETVREALHGHLPLQAYGLDAEDARDALKETRELVEGWIDAYSVDGAGDASGDDEAMGTDEEYEVDQKDDEDGLDWDL